MALKSMRSFLKEKLRFIWQLKMVNSLGFHTKYTKKSFIFDFTLEYVGNLEVVRVLIEHGAEVNAKLLDEKTPLHFAAMNGIFLVIFLVNVHCLQNVCWLVRS